MSKSCSKERARNRPDASKAEDGQTIKTLSVSSMKLIRLDTDGKMGSLAITLEDGRELRICSAYLKEMQAARFTFETKVDDEE